MVEITFGGPGNTQTFEAWARPDATPQVTMGQRPAAQPAQPTQPQAPTSGESGIMDTIGSFLVGARDNVLPAVAYGLMKANPTTSGIVDLALDQATKGAGTGAEAAAMTAADRMTIGNTDLLAGGRATLGALLTGQGMEAAQEAGNEAEALTNLNLAKARQEHALAALGGDVAGTLVTGVPFTYGFNALLNATRAGGVWASTGSVMLAAGTEEGLYTLNSGEGKAEAAKDAVTAAALAGVFKSVFDLGSGALTAIKGRGTQAIQAEMGQQIVAAMQADAARKTGQTLSAEAAMELLQSNPNKVLTDLYPSLAPRLKELASAPNPASIERANALLKGRNDLVFNYRDAVLKAAGSSSVTNPTTFGRRMEAMRSELRPKYDALFAAKDAQKWHMKVPNVGDYVFQKFDGSVTTYKEDADLLQRIVGGGTDRAKITFKELNQVRKELNDAIYQRIRYNNSASNTDSKPIRNLTAARDEVNKMLRTDATFRDLQDTYGDIARNEQAYELGQQIMRKSAMDSTDAQYFFQSNKSEAAAEAFADGAKHYLYQTVSTSPNPTNALKDSRLDDLRAIAGDEYVDIMLKSVEDIKAVQKTKDALQSGLENVRPVPATRNLAQTALDTRTASEAITGTSKGLAPRFALGRLLKAAAGDAQPTQGELQRMSAVEMDTFLKGGGGADAIRAMLLGQQRNVTGKQVAGLAGASMMPDSSTDPVGAATGAGQDGLDAISNYLTGN